MFDLKHDTPNGQQTPAAGERPLSSDDVIPRSTDWASVRWLLLVGATVFVLCLPFMRSIFGLRDQGMLLHGAERLLRGQRLYILISSSFCLPAGSSS